MNRINAKTIFFIIILLIFLGIFFLFRSCNASKQNKEVETQVQTEIQTQEQITETNN